MNGCVGEICSLTANVAHCLICANDLDQCDTNWSNLGSDFKAMMLFALSLCGNATCCLCAIKIVLLLSVEFVLRCEFGIRIVMMRLELCVSGGECFCVNKVWVML